MKREFNFDCKPTPPVKGELRFKKIQIIQENTFSTKTLKKEARLQQFDGTDWFDIPYEAEYHYV